MADVLSPEDRDEALATLDGWQVTGPAITKTFEFPGFGKAIEFVNRTTALAEKKNHHPDIDIRYDKVTLTLSTHSAGGVTQNDIELATLIEGLSA